MSKPTILASVVGHPIIACGLLLGVGAVCLQAFLGNASLGAALLAMAGGGFVLKCGKAVQQHRELTREWEAMNGGPERPNQALVAGRALRPFIGFGLWALGAFWSLEEAGDPSMALPILLFWIGTALALVILLRKWFGGGRKARREDDFVVRVVAERAAHNSPTNRLPEYCRRLFGDH